MLRRAITISLVLHLALFLSLVVYTKPVARLSSDIPTTHDTSAAIDQADLQRHSDKLKTKLKDRGFTVLIETPFVVIGDEPEAVVKQRESQLAQARVARRRR